MTDKELDAVLARAEAATPGPWDADISEPDDIGEARNATFIAHARTDVPALVAEVRRLRGEVERLSGQWADEVRLRAELAHARRLNGQLLDKLGGRVDLDE